MARHVRKGNLQAIEEVLREHPEGMTVSQIEGALTTAPPRRTLQYRLKSLVDSKRLIMVGTAAGRATACHNRSRWRAMWSHEPPPSVRGLTSCRRCRGLV